MKKIIALTLALCLMFCLAACGSSTTEPQGNNQPAGNNAGSDNTPVGSNDTTEAASNFSFTYKGVEIKLAEPAEPIIEKLGEPMKYTESASCAFDGLDKSYYYGSFYLETYPQGDKDFVYGWWFADDSISTPEGIYIGAAKADVDTAYGADAFNGTNAYTVKDGKGTLTIILENDVVSSIQYNLIVE